MSAAFHVQKWKYIIIIIITSTAENLKPGGPQNRIDQSQALNFMLNGRTMDGSRSWLMLEPKISLELRIDPIEGQISR
jgi:hypothetical protein